MKSEVIESVSCWQQKISSVFKLWNYYTKTNYFYIQCETQQLRSAGWAIHSISTKPVHLSAHPHGAPHAALVTVVGLHFQHMGAAGFSVQSPEASCHQPALSVDAEQLVAVACMTSQIRALNTHMHTHTQRYRDRKGQLK